MIARGWCKVFMDIKPMVVVDTDRHKPVVGVDTDLF